jgi:hypothetical protein
MPVLMLDDFETGVQPTEKGEETVVTPTVVKPQEPQVSQAEIEARASGWQNKEEWVASGNNAEDHVSAREFNRAGQFLGRIKHQNQQIDRLREDVGTRNQRLDALENTLKELVAHNQKLASSQVNSAKEDLYKARAEATLEQDASRMAEIDKALDDLRVLEQAPEPAPVIEEPGDQAPTQVQDVQFAMFSEWTNREENSWFEKDSIRRGAFLALGDEVAEEMGQDTPITQILDEAKKRLVAQMPGAFGGTKPPAVNQDPLNEGGGDPGSGGSGSGYGPNDLSQEQLQIAKTFEREGVMSVQEYVDQLAAVGGIGQ